MKVTPLRRKTRLVPRAKKLRLVKPSKLPPAPKRTKKGRLEEPEYLAWIRTQPCLVPGCKTRPVEAHHHGKRGFGQKCPDSETAPLCGHHHRHWWHDQSRLPGMTTEESRALIQTAGERIRKDWES